MSGDLTGTLATVAALLARGCPDEALDRAVRILYGKPVPTTTDQILVDLDAAVLLAQSGEETAP